MSFGGDQYSKKQKSDAKKILRRKSVDDDPTTIAECFPGDDVEIPFLGVCNFAFRIGRHSKGGFVRLVENNPPRKIWSVPGWVPVRCVKRYRTNETG